MTLDEFKDILDKEKLTHFDKAIYVHTLRNKPFNKRNKDIAFILNETAGSVSKLYRFATKEKENNRVIFHIITEYVNSKIPELRSYKEMKIEKLIESKKKIEIMRKQKRIAS